MRRRPEPIRGAVGCEYLVVLGVALIGLAGGLVTGISPCILAVLPVIWFTGAQGVRRRDASPTTAGGVAAAGAVETPPRFGERLRPLWVIAGLVVSFSVMTVARRALLTLLHLAPDVIRWAGLAALLLIGLGLIFPAVQQVLGRPFTWILQRQFGRATAGFGLGLALGVLYVPCAGTVLVAIILAGGAGSFGAPLVALAVAFAVGVGLPLVVFALTGQRVARCVNAFRRHERAIRLAGAMTIIALAVALVFDVPAALQRLVPDYTRWTPGQAVGPHISGRNRSRRHRQRPESWAV